MCDSLWSHGLYSLESSSIHGILQARGLELGAIYFSRGLSRPSDRTQLSRIAGRCFTLAPPGKSNVNSRFPYSIQYPTLLDKNSNFSSKLIPGLCTIPLLIPSKCMQNLTLLHSQVQALCFYWLRGLSFQQPGDPIKMQSKLFQTSKPCDGFAFLQYSQENRNYIGYSKLRGFLHRCWMT